MGSPLSQGRQKRDNHADLVTEDRHNEFFSNEPRIIAVVPETTAPAASVVTAMTPAGQQWA